MALGYGLIFSIVDEKGATSTTEIRLPVTTAWADVLGMAAALPPLIDALISGAITRVGIVFDFTLTGGVKLAALAGSDVEEGARFQFRTENNFFTHLRIPTFLESLIVAGTREVDLTDSDVAAFVTAMEDGIDLAGAAPIVEPSDSRGEDIVALVSAQEQFLSSRKS